MVSLAFSLAVTSFLMSTIALFIVLWSTLRKFSDRPERKNDIFLDSGGSRRAATDLNRQLVPDFILEDGMPEVFDPEGY